MTKLKVTLLKSRIGQKQPRVDALAGLGLRKIRTVRVLENTPAVRGLIKQVIDLVDVEEVEA